LPRFKRFVLCVWEALDIFLSFGPRIKDAFFMAFPDYVVFLFFGHYPKRDLTILIAIAIKITPKTFRKTCVPAFPNLFSIQTLERKTM